MRKCKDWIEAYMEYTEESEPPLLYREWVGMFTIASALKRKVYLPQGLRSPIYPNLYVILVGAPGRCRKGTSMAVGKDLMERVGIKLAPTSITIEALIGYLEDNETLEADGSVHSSMSVMSEELMVFLDYNNGKFLSSLTDMYDCADHWEYKTKNMGTNEIVGVWLNLLGATTPHLIQTALPPDSIGGGLASRMIFVYEDDKAKTLNLKTRLNPREEKLRDHLVHDLAEMNLMSGQYHFTPEAQVWFDDWYLNMTARMKPMPPSFEGYVNRRPTHLQKAAMILSASRGEDMMITPDDLRRALDLHERTEIRMGRTFTGVGISRLSGVMESMKEYIVSNTPVQLTDMHATFGANFDGSKQFLEALSSLRDQGFFKYEKTIAGNTLLKYQTTYKYRDMYR